MNIITDAAPAATAIRLTGDGKPRPIDAGSLAVHPNMVPARDAVEWRESGRRHHAPLAAVVEIIAEGS